MWVNKNQLLAIAVLLGQAAAVASAMADEEAPSEEMLEFLGEFQTQDGEWFDPLNLLEVKQSDFQPEQIQQPDSEQSATKPSATKQTESVHYSEEHSDE